MGLFFKKMMFFKKNGCLRTEKVIVSQIYVLKRL